MRFKPRTSEIDGDHCANYATAICQHYFMWKFTRGLNPGRQLQSLVPLRLSPRPHRQFGLVLSILNTGISSYPIKDVFFAVKNNFTMTTQKEFTLCRRTNSISRERRRRRCFSLFHALLKCGMACKRRWMDFLSYLHHQLHIIHYLGEYSVLIFISSATSITYLALI